MCTWILVLGGVTIVLAGSRGFNAVRVIDMQRLCFSYRGLDSLPTILRRSVVLQVSPQSRESSTALSATETHDDDQVNVRVRHVIATAPTTNTSLSTEGSPKDDKKPRTKLAKDRPTIDSFQRIFGYNSKRIPKCRILFKCPQRNCRHLLQIQHTRYRNSKREPFNLSVLDGNLATIAGASSPTHIRLSLGPGLGQPDEICLDSNQCITSGDLVTIAYETVSGEWFHPFNITITTIMPEIQPGGVCPWSYVLCKKNTICISKSLLCDGHPNCGNDDDTDENACAKKSNRQLQSPSTTNDVTSVQAHNTEKTVAEIPSEVYLSMPLMYAAILTATTIAIVVLAIVIRRRKIFTQIKNGKMETPATDRNIFAFSFGNQSTTINDPKVTKPRLNVVDMLSPRDAICESDRLVCDDRIVVEVTGSGIHANLQNLQELTSVEKGS